jgi:Flp pilus assembly protein protease CpaA
MFGAPVIGGGAIKLMAVIGATLGIKLALEVGVTFIISLCILAAVSVFIFYIGRVPSSPFILSSIFLVYVWNYGSRFLVPSE